MSKEITKSIILQEIQDKFKLREFEPANFLFDETVVPIYDIGPHLLKYRGKTLTVSITSMSAFQYYEVPDNEMWTLRGYNVIFMTGSFTVSGVYHKRPTSAYHYMDLAPAQSISYAVNLPFPVLLNAGDSIWINIDGYVSTGDLQLRIDYKVETLR